MVKEASYLRMDVTLKRQYWSWDYSHPEFASILEQSASSACRLQTNPVLLVLLILPLFAAMM